MSEDLRYKKLDLTGNLTESDRAYCDVKANHILGGQIPCVVIVSDIPEEDLEPNPNLPGVFQLVSGSHTASMSAYVTQKTKRMCSTAQRSIAGSFDSNGQRAKKNHDLVCFTF
jgi:hypothetical protein